MNIYKNGYLLHCIVGYAIYETFRDYGMWWGICAVAFFAIGKEIYDAIVKKKWEMKDILSTLAGCILAMSVEWVKSV